jgi:hypothetical protein
LLVAAAMGCVACEADRRLPLRISSWADDIEQRIESRNIQRFEQRTPACGWSTTPSARRRSIGSRS